LGVVSPAFSISAHLLSMGADPCPFWVTAVSVSYFFSKWRIYSLKLMKELSLSFCEALLRMDI
jgi:hypothetical protein